MSLTNPRSYASLNFSLAIDLEITFYLYDRHFSLISRHCNDSHEINKSMQTFSPTMYLLFKIPVIKPN